MLYDTFLSSENGLKLRAWASHSMADAKVCRGPRRFPLKRPCEDLPAGRSRSYKRNKHSVEVESQNGEVISCNANGFVNPEVDLSTKVESNRNSISIKRPKGLKFGKHQNSVNPKRQDNFKSGNPTNPKNSECLESANPKSPQILVSANPKAPEILVATNPKAPENLVSTNPLNCECICPRYRRRRNREILQCRNHKHEIEAEAGSRIKAEGASEVNFKLEDDSLNPGRSIMRNPALKRAANKNKGQPLSLKSRRRKKVSGSIDDFESENNCTDKLPAVLDLDEGSLANNRKVTSLVCKDGKSVVQSSMPCGVIGSKKIPHISCEEPHLALLIPTRDKQEETRNRWSPKKGPGKKSMQLRGRNAAVKLDNYLDTDVIDRYMEHIWKKLPKHKRESCTYLDCLWFSMYLEEALSFNVLKWTKAKRIFTKQYVFIPIVHWGHWNLLILCHFGEDLSSEARTPCMLLLDSLKEADPNRLEPLIRKFLIDLHKEDGREDGDKIIAEIPLLVPEVPQQTNGNDCGVFLLHFVDKFLKQAPKNFSICEGCYPYFFTKNWFKSREIGKRRKHIYDVILKDRHSVSQMTERRISTRSKKLHGFLNSNHGSKWIDLSTAA